MGTVTLSRGQTPAGGEDFRSTTRYRYVEPQEFLRLVVSREFLLRSDDPVHGVRGLHDPATGVTFVVEQDRIRSGA